MQWCKWFGHKWIPVYIGKNGKWKIISVYCERCRYGYSDIIKFLDLLGYGVGYDFGTYSEKYFKEELQNNRIPH